MTEVFHSSTSTKEIHQLLGWAHDPVIGEHLHASFTLGRGYKNNAPEDGAAMRLPTLPLVVDGQDFGNIMLTQMMCRSSDFDKEKDLDRYLEAIGAGMMARDIRAVRALWDFLCEHAFEASSEPEQRWVGLVLQATWPPITASLIAFLALDVQRPQLLLVLVKALRYNNTRAGEDAFDSFVQQPCIADLALPKSESEVNFNKEASRKPLLTTIAAILSSHYYVSRKDNKTFEEHAAELERRRASITEEGKHELRGEYDDAEGGYSFNAWDCVIDLLFGLLSHTSLDYCAGLVYAASSHKGCYHWHPINLLKIALVCSELSLEPLRSALRWFKFPRDQVCLAIRWALEPSTAPRGSTHYEAVCALYAAFLTPTTRTIPPSWYDDKHGDVDMSLLWIHLVETSTGYHDIPLLDMPGVRRVREPRMGIKSRSPEFYLEMLSQWAFLTTERDYLRRERVDQRACLFRALKLCFERLVDTSDGKLNWKSCTLHRIMELMCARPEWKEWLLQGQESKALVKIQKNQTALLPDTIALLFYKDGACQVDLVNQHFDDIQEALIDAVMHSKRQSVHHLLSLLEHNKPRLATALGKMRNTLLADFVERMCDSRANPNPDMSRFSAETTTMIHETMRRDLVRFLEAGNFLENPIAREVALVKASWIYSGIAAQVLVSPPYNTPIPKADGDDGFVRTIVDAVFSPDAQLAKSVGAEWEARKKRAFGEVGDGEGEE